jgi:manganese oxidase
VNGTYIYNWQVPEEAGPGPADGSSVFWTYQSMVDWNFDLFTGLAGGIIVTRRGAAGAIGVPSDVDREVCSNGALECV